MYPDNATELAALLAVLVPLIIATFAGLRASLTRAAEARSARWKRLNELAIVLYNNGVSSGLWAQIAAAHELGDTAGSTKKAALAILESARRAFADNDDLANAINAAINRANRGWAKRVFGFLGD